jgi:hypothetical protein
MATTATLLDGWDNVAEELSQQSKEDSLQADLADACRSSSVSDDDSCPTQTLPLPTVPTATPNETWWSSLLLKHTAHLVNPKPSDTKKPITVLSGCIGSFPEAAVLEATCWIAVCTSLLAVLLWLSAERTSHDLLSYDGPNCYRVELLKCPALQVLQNSIAEQAHPERFEICHEPFSQP